ncbi:unnamed protein product [Linum tenue]|uniref:Uncharacterized protein n=1 Tax=Linum tenue TaxID=586396 RepID=A0AAV0RN74_9ROSI|nr:unnamed protein product [Linum tenue]
MRGQVKARHLFDTARVIDSGAPVITRSQARYQQPWPHFQGGLDYF